MPKKNNKDSQNGTERRYRPATTPEGREKQLIALAMDRAEQQLIDGTASSQVITHFLKLATAQANLERERLANENALLQAKAEQIKAEKTSAEMFEKAISAFNIYSGRGADDHD